MRYRDCGSRSDGGRGHAQGSESLSRGWLGGALSKGGTIALTSRAIKSNIIGNTTNEDRVIEVLCMTKNKLGTLFSSLISHSDMRAFFKGRTTAYFWSLNREREEDAVF